jgi:hypothetical protein
VTRQFKVGDRVRVRQWMEREFGLTQGGDISCDVDFDIDMHELCGKTATVRKVIGNRVILCDKEDSNRLNWDWKFTPDMFEPVTCEFEEGEPE